MVNMDSMAAESHRSASTSTTSSEQTWTRRRPGRVPTSCAECRRLKLRCDRKVPCDNCIRRKCASICPYGSQTTTKGNKAALANTEDLHEQLERLVARNKELEEELESLRNGSPAKYQSLAKTTPSPAPDTSIEEFVQKGTSSEEDTFVKAFGTLSIGPRGETVFLGKTARTEYLINAPWKGGFPASCQNTQQPSLSARVAKAISIITEGGVADDGLCREVYDCLPPYTEAVYLCELYLEHGKYAWWCTVSREELFDECLTIVYHAESYDELMAKRSSSLSLLFIVFALATLQDPNQPSYSSKAEEYYIYAWLTYHFVPVQHQLTIASTQVLVHVTQYLEVSDWQLKPAARVWVFLGIAANCGSLLGLHLDGSRWNLPPAMIERRRRTFWQIFFLDTWISLCFGRPPNISLAYIDCGFPEDTEQVVNEEGEMEPGFHHWMWKYTILVHKVMAIAFGAKIPEYPTVLSLERAVRDYPIARHLRSLCRDADVRPTSPALSIQKWCVLGGKECLLLNLHRAYFAQALHDQPDDLFSHKYAPSVISAYRSSWRLIEGLRITVAEAFPNISRIATYWTHGLSAAIIMCLLVTKAPKSHFVRPALMQLDRVSRCFEDAARKCPPAAHFLGSIRSLQQKAHAAFNNIHTQDSSSLSPEELDRLSGKTKLIQDQQEDALSGNPSLWVPNMSSAGGSYPVQMDPFHEFYTVESIHPAIAQDMEAFNHMYIPPFDDRTLFEIPPDPSNFMLPDMQDYETQPQYTPAQTGVPLMTGWPDYLSQEFQPSQPYTSAADRMVDNTWQHFVEQLGLDVANEAMEMNLYTCPSVNVRPP